MSELLVDGLTREAYFDRWVDEMLAIDFGDCQICKAVDVDLRTVVFGDHECNDVGFYCVPCYERLFPEPKT